jgi:5'-3' exonuclease
MGICVVIPPGLEADDVLASTAHQATAIGATTVVVTSDRDAFALIDERTHVLRIINGGVESSPLITAERLPTLIGIRPEQYADYAALRGDPSDNLPGVRGFGSKTAARLLGAAGCAEAAFDDPDRPEVVRAIGPALAARLHDPELRAAWQRNRQVMALRTDVAVPLSAAPPASGGLPLQADAVREVFGLMQLTWTTTEAVRVLCGECPPELERRIAWDTVPPHATSWIRRPPPLRRQPASAQLALFD